MNAAYVALAALVLLALGYRFYGRFLARHVYRTETGDEEPTPAEVYNDGTDYVPTPRGIVFGHHFSSIAGAAPILGPAVAVVWGWLPALLWVVLGTIFMGAVHDYGALIISVKHKGQSIGAVTEKIIGARSRMLFLTVIFLLVFIVIAVFAYIIANLFILYPGSVIPINFEIIIAIIIGYWTHYRKKNLLLPSLVALLLLYFMIYVGFEYPVRLPEYLWLFGSEIMSWILFLMIYGFIAAVLPVWVLLQPRDYINSHQLIAGLALIYAAIFISGPQMDAPAINSGPVDMQWFPFLFITIACGAISGFHSLVASGTTSKQLAKVKDARLVGYGGMTGEATLAVAATIAVAAGFSGSEAWHHHYENFSYASGLQGSLQAFVEGTASFLSAIGINQTMTDGQGAQQSLAAVFVSVIVISFAATSLDTAVRIQRYIIGEIGEAVNGRKFFQNRYVVTAVAVGLSFLLVITDGSGRGGLRLWPLFGSTNQMVGSLALLVISVWLFRLGRNMWFTLLPMIIITLITFIATVANFLHYLDEQNQLLVFLAFVIGICQIWIIVEGIRIFFDRSPDTEQDIL
ncbi:MAG: carbon starvation protein A [Bacteroidia bacterium]